MNEYERLDALVESALERDAACYMGDHEGPNCRNCGTVNYRWLGYLGAVASAAKRWGVSREEAEARIERHERHMIAEAERSEG